MRKTIIAVIGIILLSFAVGVYFYGKMPESMASHWNSQGIVNGYIPRFWGLFLMPIISIAMFLLFIAVPCIDPLKKNIKKFMSYYDAFIVFIMLFLFYIYLLTIFWNLGYRFSMIVTLVPAFSLLCYFIAMLLENAKRNWFIGIKTPWTLSSDSVWRKTHEHGAKLFRIAAVVCLLGLIIQRFAFLIVVASIILAAIWLFIYSYLLFRKLKRK